MRGMQRLALALTIIGALNWGVMGLFRFDAVAGLAGGSAAPVARLIYIVIGVSGLITLSLLFEGWREREYMSIKKTEPDI